MTQMQDVPDVVVTLGAGSIGECARLPAASHLAAARWQYGESGRLPELLIGSDGLQRPAVDIFGTLPHKSRSRCRHVRDMKDRRTDRQHRRAPSAIPRPTRPSE